MTHVRAGDVLLQAQRNRVAIWMHRERVNVARLQGQFGRGGARQGKHQDKDRHYRRHNAPNTFRVSHLMNIIFINGLWQILNRTACPQAYSSPRVAPPRNDPQTELAPFRPTQPPKPQVATPPQPQTELAPFRPTQPTTNPQTTKSAPAPDIQSLAPGRSTRVGLMPSWRSPSPRTGQPGRPGPGSRKPRSSSGRCPWRMPASGAAPHQAGHRSSRRAAQR